MKLSEALAKVLAAAGITKEAAEDLATEIAAKYPELAMAREVFVSKLAEQLNPSLNITTIAGLAAGAWDELKSGHPGFNRHTFGGG